MRSALAARFIPAVGCSLVASGKSRPNASSDTPDENESAIALKIHVVSFDISHPAVGNAPSLFDWRPRKQTQMEP
jgi:hypothetical protein